MSAEHVDGVLHPQFVETTFEVLTRGLGASPGAAVGKVYFTADKAAEAARHGEDVILVRLRDLSRRRPRDARRAKDC